MSYLDQVNIAVSPYIGRSQKAIEFYKNNKKENVETTGSLFLALAHGPTGGWTDDTPELPSLNTIELDNIFKFIWYDKMYFVQSDVDGKLNVGNLTWSLISNPDSTDDEKYFRNVRNAGSRWIYVEFNTNANTDRKETEDTTIRQIGLYSNLMLTENASVSNTVFFPSEVSKVSDGLDNRYYDGVLTLIQNKSAYEATETSNYSFILEF